MNVVSSWWQGLGMRAKLQILIQGFLIVAFGAAQAWVSARFEERFLEDVRTRARTVADGAINGLNTLMVTKVGSDDVISNKTARALFIQKMGALDRIEELRIVRAKNIDDEFGQGLPQERAVDETDRRVLADGKPVFELTDDGAGKASLRAVMPFIAMKDFHGTKCLKCHGVDEGAVLGVASVVIDVREELASMKSIKAWLWAGQLVIQLACAAALYVVARGVFRQIGGEPGMAAGLARLVARGDLSTRLDVKPGDATSLMACLREMQSGLAGVVGDVRRSAEGLAVSSEQIAQGNLDLSNRTEQQASSLQQTAASMEQLSVAVKNNAEHARQANQLALDASDVAVKGGQVVGEVVHTMRDINAGSRKIGDIIGVIDGIAFQTNILALNAAVEAARAGEQGRGFAVVASEVRSLASRSAMAAREVKSLIGASLERAEHGSALVEQAGTAMTEIVASIERVTAIMGEISTASGEQSLGVARVGEAVSQMDRVTQQNAALVEQSAAAAESLKAQAQRLVQTVAVFKLETGADDGARAMNRG
jgi:methyl-accepting chemotaxis protein